MVRSRADSTQVLQDVYIEDESALRVKFLEPITVAFDGGANEVEIDAADGDSIMIVGTEDGTPTGTQRTAKINSSGELVVSGSVTTTPEPAPEDFRASTQNVTNIATAITFGGFTMVSLSLYAPPSNGVNIRIGKSDVATNYFLFTPGSTINLPLQASTEPVYFLLDSPGTAVISILALGS